MNIKIEEIYPNQSIKKQEKNSQFKIKDAF